MFSEVRHSHWMQYAFHPAPVALYCRMSRRWHILHLSQICQVLSTLVHTVLHIIVCVCVCVLVSNLNGTTCTNCGIVTRYTFALFSVLSERLFNGVYLSHFTPLSGQNHRACLHVWVELQILPFPMILSTAMFVGTCNYSNNYYAMDGIFQRKNWALGTRLV